MRRRGLVVNDEPVVCDMNGKVLHSAGMEALTLTRSTESPEVLDEGKFDVVFLDLHMPSPDGIVLYHSLSELAKLACAACGFWRPTI